MERPLAVITGASAGLGAEFARQLASRGYDLLLIARRSDSLDKVRNRITGTHPVACEILSADLASDLGLSAVEQKLRAASNLEILVNNAGFGTLGRFFEAPLGPQEQMHRLHVLATMRLCHTALPIMIQRRRGGIINVSSVSGFLQSAGAVSYCATKAWMNTFTECLMLELKAIASPVKVQALCPGYTNTEFHDRFNMDKSRIPSFLWLNAERVVRESLAAFDRGDLFVIPGLRYRVLMRMHALLPRRLKHVVSLRTSRIRRPKSVNAQSSA